MPVRVGSTSVFRPPVAGDFTAPPHFRGHIINERTSALYEFNINPNEVQEDKGSHISDDPIPGFSHPKLDWAAGKTASIHLTIDLDAEMTFRVRGVAFFNRADTGYDPDQYTVRNEIAFFEHFQFPGKPELGGRGADIALLTWGSRYSATACLVDDVKVHITESSPEGEPTKAKITMVLKRVIDDNVFAEDVFQP